MKAKKSVHNLRQFLHQLNWNLISLKHFLTFFEWIIKEKYWPPCSGFFFNDRHMKISLVIEVIQVLGSITNSQNLTIYFSEHFQICQFSWFIFCLNVSHLCIMIANIGKVLIWFQELGLICINILKCTIVKKHCICAIICFLKRCYSQIDSVTISTA